MGRSKHVRGFGTRMRPRCFFKPAFFSALCAHHTLRLSAAHTGMIAAVSGHSLLPDFNNLLQKATHNLLFPLFINPHPPGQTATDHRYYYYYICHPTIAGDFTNISLNFTMLMLLLLLLLLLFIIIIIVVFMCLSLKNCPGLFPALQYIHQSPISRYYVILHSTL